MSKMDALNQQFVCRVCRALNLHNVGLCDKNETVRNIENIRHEYLDAMIDILREDNFNDNE